MDTHEITGGIKQAAGTVEESFGRATGDRATELSGAARKVAGQVEGAYGDAVDITRSTIGHSPLLSLGLTAVAAFTLGALVSGFARSAPPAPPARRKR
ncbi:general stress protein CsbD [Sphingomonas sp. Leaf357]|uniref:CsbD family protein n=1 Tax=Sphingomonas sp. Leaf357 TaxID=1736350 RepID=UPI0006FFEC67|nr:CsbD family protein [Sphingomonas sp. Leaf357]KQS05069.1 general stress protein CsbD [Sphingomonas sp. Leaf357]